jgi:hypothetical protein
MALKTILFTNTTYGTKEKNFIENKLYLNLIFTKSSTIISFR